MSQAPNDVAGNIAKFAHSISGALIAAKRLPISGCNVPSATVRHFADPLPYQHALQAAEIEISPTARGQFDAKLVQVRLDRIWMQRSEERLPRVWVGTVASERIVLSFLSDSAQQPMYHCGMEVAPELLILNGNSLAHRRTSATSRWGSVSLARNDLASISKALCGQELEISTATRLIRPSIASKARLLDLHQKLANLAEASSDNFVLTETIRSLENEVIHAMVRCIDEREPESLTHAGRNHTKIIRQFEEFLAQNLFQPVYLAEICAATGASERTLRACCQEYLGMGPVRYLWLRRMHLVRRALALATPQSASVTQTAMDHGFWELGRFATQYRSLFGESPSATLQRPPGPDLTRHQ